MVTKMYEVTHDKPIHVDGKERQPGETFENERTSDILPLLTNGYLKEVKA